jgi:hypothetical protein
MERSGANLCIRKISLPGLSDAKIKEGVFVGPQIRELIFAQNLNISPVKCIKAAWKSFKNIRNNFGGKS